MQLAVKKRNNTTGIQYQKSLATRNKIIKTAIKCFIEYGYQQTTYIKISNISGLSRGAMRHHFPSKIDIVKAAIDYLYEKRLKAFRQDVSNRPPNVDRISYGLESFWQQVNHPLYKAFFELSVATRTDAELEAVLRPAEEAFNLEYQKTATEVFPEWKHHPKALRLAMNLCRYLLEGMAVDVIPPSKEDATQLLEYLGQHLRELSRSD